MASAFFGWDYLFVTIWWSWNAFTKQSAIGFGTIIIIRSKVVSKIFMAASNAWWSVEALDFKWHIIWSLKNCTSNVVTLYSVYDWWSRLKLHTTFLWPDGEPGACKTSATEVAIFVVYTSIIILKRDHAAIRKGTFWNLSYLQYMTLYNII